VAYATQTSTEEKFVAVYIALVELTVFIVCMKASLRKQWKETLQYRSKLTLSGRVCYTEAGKTYSTKKMKATLKKKKNQP